LGRWVADKMKIAIMQPYFIPYAGYFRLFLASDIFVVYDDVQFMKESWINRNIISINSDKKDWLTLPLKKSPLNTEIKDKQFADKANEIWLKTVRKFPIITKNIGKNKTVDKVVNLNGTLVNYLVGILEDINQLLQIKSKIIYSSSLDYNRSKKGEERVIEIVKAIDGSEYINSPGGVGLYKKESFENEGIKLKFLTQYEGSNKSILERILTQNIDDIRKEIQNNTQFI